MTKIIDKGLTDTKYSYCEFLDGRTTNVNKLVIVIVFYYLN